MTAPVVEATNIHLAYRMDRNRATTLKQFAMDMFRGQVQHETFWALTGISISVEPGEILGVIGPNGAGKSTLMKVVARVLPPTEGRIIVRGSVAAIIALGAGFNPDLTARENVVLYGTLLGRDTLSVRSRVGPILQWAGLEEFENVPIRSFSSGMVARLSFSIATDQAADILIVDEVLAVGDEDFRRKSLARMKDLMSGGTSVVFVSHGLPTVRSLCERVMWLDHGEIRMLGEPNEVVTAYEESVRT